MDYLTLQSSQTALLIVDVQGKIFDVIQKQESFLKSLKTIIKSFKTLGIPIVCSEQYPKGLGHTVSTIQQELEDLYQPWIKSSFSCLGESKLAEYICSIEASQWIIVGLEAHICVLQTAKDLIKQGKNVIILSDCIDSRYEKDYLSALQEMRTLKMRVTTVQTLLFELLQSAAHPRFSEISQIIKAHN